MIFFMKKILVTNDDGIDSFFLKTLVEVLRENFDVVIAAPLKDQSWIGKAMSRDKILHMAEYVDSVHWTNLQRINRIPIS